MLKTFVVALLMVTSLSLSSCSNNGSESSETPTGGTETPKTSTGGSEPQATSTDSGELQKYTSSTNGYEFMHPTAWKPEATKGEENNVDLLLRNSERKGETVYVVIRKAPKGKTLADLGDASAFGNQLIKGINESPNSENKAELIGAKSRDAGGKTYYTLEYKVKSPKNQERHNLASVAVNQDKLFIFTVSAPDKVWNQRKEFFEEMANSFAVK